MNMPTKMKLDAPYWRGKGKFFISHICPDEHRSHSEFFVILYGENLQLSRSLSVPSYLSTEDQLIT